MAKKKFIVLEGLSGTGKTEVGKLLARTVHGLFVQTPPLFFMRARPEIDEQADTFARFFFYLGGVVESAREIRERLHTHTIVCDRFWMTTFCYHRALGINIDFAECIIKQLPQPEYTFLITCREKIRQQRLQQRGLTVNDTQEAARRIDKKFLAEYQKYDCSEIDNSTSNPQDAVNLILARLQS